MGETMAKVLRVLHGGLPDAESSALIAELVAAPSQWSAGHAVFDEVRRRLQVAVKAKETLRELQHHFEESCGQAVYNAANPADPFDASVPFFVVPQALALARGIEIPFTEVVSAVVSE